MKRILLLLVVTACLAQQPPDEPGLYATFDTSFGIIRARLFENEVRSTVRNFVQLAQGTKPWGDPVTHKVVARPFYKNITWHRVITFFMIQTGSQTASTAEDCGIRIRDEVVPTLNFDVPGRLAMANTGEKDSGGCQMFITEVADPKMNGKYTIFGQVVEGMEVVKKISRVIKDENDKPRLPVKLNNVTIKRIFPPTKPEAKP